jgi:hypothetical protein
MPVTSGLRKLREEDCKFKASVGYITYQVSKKINAIEAPSITTTKSNKNNF